MAEYRIGTLADFPVGSHQVVKAGRIEVGVFNVGGSLYALPNICPHQAGPLCDGPVTGEWRCSAATGWLTDFARRGEVVVCPWHGIEFDIATGVSLATSKLRVRPYQVVIDGDEVRISTSR